MLQSCQGYLFRCIIKNCLRYDELFLVDHVTEDWLIERIQHIKYVSMENIYMECGLWKNVA